MLKPIILLLYIDCIRSFFLLASAMQVLMILCTMGGALLSHLMEEMRGKTALCIGLVYVAAEVICHFVSDAEIYLTSMVGIMLLSLLMGFLFYFIASRIRAAVRHS